MRSGVDAARHAGNDCDAALGQFADAGRRGEVLGLRPNTVLALCDVVDGRSILPALDLLGVAASQGSACASGAPRPPRILEALGFAMEVARRAVRFSFSHESSPASAASAAERVREFLTRAKALGDA